MRIQEMRSGLAHLKKKDAAPETDQRTSPLYGIEGGAGLCDLDRPIWSVISFDEMEAGGMLYQQALRLMAALEADGLPGLCIVTDTAARSLV
jgi:hypothetical protein